MNDQVNFIRKIAGSVRITEESTSDPTYIEGSGRERNSPRLVRHPDGKLKAVYIHQSMIGKMIFQNTRIDYCAKQIHDTDLMLLKRSQPTVAMSIGLYGEAGCLNEGKLRDKNLKLPKGRGGKKSVVMERVDEQIFNFHKNIVPYSHLIVVPYDQKGSNIWRKYCVSFGDALMERDFHIKIFIEMEVDLISPIDYTDGKGSKIKHKEAIIDVKFPKDRWESGGKFCWAYPDRMDHIQAYTYSFILNLPFIYLLIDYKKEGRGWRFLPINTDLENPNSKLANEAKNRKNEFIQAVRMVVAEIIHNERTGWKTNNMPENCKMCPLTTCPDRNRISTY